MGKKRTIVNKAEEMECQLCKQMISKYGMVMHIRIKHRGEKTVDEYVEAFGEFRQNKENKPKSKVASQVTCELCNRSISTMGMAVHLRDTHDTTIDEYLEDGYSEFRPEKIKTNKLIESANGKFKCLICGNESSCEKVLSEHISTEHNLSKVEYIKTYILNDNVPLCKCGCGSETKIINSFPYYREFISGHNSNGENNPMFGKYHENDALMKMRSKARERLLIPTNKKNTAPEKMFADFLNKNDITFIPQHPSSYGVVDFYLPEYDLFIEIDGVYWHPITYDSLNVQLLDSIITQINRKDMDNLIRLRSDILHNIKTLEDCHSFNFKYDFFMPYYTKILTKEYIKTLDEKTLKLIKNKLFRIVRLYQPTFPDIPTSETIDEIREKIGKYDLNGLLDGNVFNNNSSLIGVSYLKSTFKSYWKSSYKGQKSPIEAWNDDNIMRKIIEYRIGLNSSGEVFDFSIHQLIRGLSARRFNISFFKPVLAAAIYRHFIGNNPNPIVFDPCCGFGGRLLAFKSVYPNGTYIGCEPNIETYNELVELSKNFTDVSIYNCKIEDFNLSLLPDGIDLTFTSIPYFDTETYSNPVQYSTFESWKDEFIGKVNKLPKLLLNVPENLKDCFEGYEEYKISTNTSHFNQKNGKKFEYLLKF